MCVSMSKYKPKKKEKKKKKKKARQKKESIQFNEPAPQRQGDGLWALV